MLASPEQNTEAPWAEPAKVRWHDRTLESLDYQDVYFSRSGGEQETERLFLELNDLPSIWRSLPDTRDARNSCFYIGETGFGSGLNFVCAWRSFLKHAPAGWRLHYLTVEKRPLGAADRARVRLRFPSLDTQFAALDKAMPAPLSGWHRRRFAGGRIILSIYFGEAETGMEELLTEGAQMHCWFLDGFTPKRNPDIWQDSLLQKLARLTRPGGSCTTFTVSGAVRRGLQSAGFQVSKETGAGAKRQYLLARLPPGDRPEGEQPESGNLTVIGGGFAGAWSARLLAERGWSVLVLDKGHKQPFCASATPAAVWHPRLNKSCAPAAIWRLTTAGFASSQLASDYQQPSGLLQLQETQSFALGAPDTDRLWRAVSAEEASDLAGLPLSAGGLWFPCGGWLAGSALCASLLDHPGIRHVEGCEVRNISRTEDGWRLTLTDGETRAATLILANAYDAALLVPSLRQALGISRGQLDAFSCDKTSARLRVPLVAPGRLLTPAKDGWHWAGSSRRELSPNRRGASLPHCGASPGHHSASSNLQPSAKERQENAHRFEETLGRAMPTTAGQSFVATRCIGRDHLPLTGRIGPGLWINAGFGSHGVMQAPLAAELLAAAISAEPIPERRLLQLLSPDRFEKISESRNAGG